MTQNNRRGFIRRFLGAGFACCVGSGRTALAEALKEPTRLRVVTLEGSPSECGLTHGKSLKTAIHALLKVWKADLAERYRMDADAFIKKFLERTNYLPALKKWTPELIEEIAGIARAPASTSTRCSFFSSSTSTGSTDRALLTSIAVPWESVGGVISPPLSLRTWIWKGFAMGFRPCCTSNRPTRAWSNSF